MPFSISITTKKNPNEASSMVYIQYASLQSVSLIKLWTQRVYVKVSGRTK